MIRKILIVQLRQLGDILLTTPCVREIKRENPKAHVTFLSHRMGQLVLDGNPYVDEYFKYDEKMRLGEQIKMALGLRERGYDQAIDYMNNPRSAIFTFISGAYERIAFQSARRLAYTDIVPRPANDYIVRQKFKLLEAAGFKPKDETLILPWIESHTGPLVRCLGENQKFKDAKLRVVLSPTHRRALRKWPHINYAKLADYLTEHMNACVFWIWGPGEEEEINQVMAMCKLQTYKSPPTTFKEMAAFMANQDLFIGNSNGPSHVAVAVNICSLQLHGPTLARAWCPMNEQHRAIQSQNVSEETGSMKMISLENVIAKISEMRDVILAHAQKRCETGIRLSWRR